MRLGKLDLNLLVALDHLLALRSITRAAERMHLTQSAMSSALRRLREYFDDPLLVQIGRDMELTPRAKALKDPLREILASLDFVLAAGLTFDPTTSDRQFRLLVSDYTLTVFAPLLLQLAKEEGATTRFVFMPQAKSPHEVIDRGETDAVIAPDVFTSSEHPSEAVFSDRFVAAVWTGGRYGKQPLSAEEYGEGGHLVVVPPSGTLTLQEDLLARIGIMRRFEIETYSFAALAPLVVGTDRIATMHRLLAEGAARSFPLTLHPLPFDVPAINEHIQWHRQMTTDPGLVWLRGLAGRAAARLTAG